MCLKLPPPKSANASTIKDDPHKLSPSKINFKIYNDLLWHVNELISIRYVADMSYTSFYSFYVPVGVPVLSVRAIIRKTTDVQSND